MLKLFGNSIVKNTFLFVIIGGFILFIGYIILLGFFNNINTLFNITAHTEIISFQTIHKPISRYNLNNATIHVTENFDFKEVFAAFNGSLEINKDVKVEIERLSYGTVNFSLESTNGQSVGNLYEGNNKVYEIGDYMLIEIHKIDSLLNSGKSIVFPLSGIVKLGKSVDVEIYDETSPVLRDGTITMTGYTKFSDGRYFEAGNEKLYLGDCLEFEETETIGFAVVNDNPALQVSYRVESEEAIVVKPGPKGKNSGYRISASLYDRFVNDRLFQGLSLIFASLLVMTSLIDFLANMYKLYKRNNP